MNSKDIQQSLFIDMGTVLNTARQHLDEQFKEYDLTRLEWLILGMLRLDQNGVSQSYAKGYLAVENSYFTKLLNTLESRGFIEREIDKNDRRNRIIKISKNPPAILKDIFQKIYDLNEAIEIDLTSKDLECMHESLRKIQDRLTKIRSLK